MRTCFMSVEPTHDDLRGPSYKEPRNTSVERSAVNREGMTLVPLKIYFNDRGRAKMELALARGKKLHDKRETSKERDWNRQKSRLLKERG